MSAKIVRLCADPDGKDRNNPKNAEWVQLEAQSQGSLRGYRLQHQTNPGQPSQAWQTLYTFNEDTVFRKGDLIMIHSGGGHDHTDTSGMHHRYAAGPNGKGNWRINNSGDKLRILDPSGAVISEVAVRAGQCDIPAKPPVPVVVAPPARSFGSE